MSVLCSNDKGWVISHYDYTKKIYTNVLSHSGVINLTYNRNLFGIMTPLMRDQEVRNLVLKEICEKEFVLSEDIKRKRAKSQFDNEIELVETNYSELIKLASANNIFSKKPSKEDYLSNNKNAREAAELYNSSLNASSYNGGNKSDNSLLISIANKTSVVPPRCTFFSCDVRLISEKVKEEFDFVLMDPPWRNKFVKRKKSLNKGYSMLSDADIKNIPIRKLLKNSGLVGIWCTNAPSHINEVKENFFKCWDLEHVATWFWVKVTQCGTPICSFSSKNGKKPYERIIFGARPNSCAKIPEDGKTIISIPSSIHSHKPPLNDILANYLPMKPSCIEIFARYLLPDWTSLGDQVLSLQTLDLFEYC